VLVTCNYKLTFDAVRSALPHDNCWLLVVDTRGINVWCAGGKGTFSAEEVAYQVNRAQLAELVSHRKLTLPQLAANGIAAFKLPGLCGFRGEFGPISAAMLPEYLASRKTEERMRSVTFTLGERAILIPVEILQRWKTLLFLAVGFFLLSGLGPQLFSVKAAVSRSLVLLAATGVGICGGAVLTPLLLPWLPARQFWVKGLLPGIVLAILFLATAGTGGKILATLTIFCWICAVSSYLAMSFTGCTPYTSLSGVAREMRSGLMLQLGLAATALVAWIVTPFF